MLADQAIIILAAFLLVQAYSVHYRTIQLTSCIRQHYCHIAAIFFAAHSSNSHIYRLCVAVIFIVVTSSFAPALSVRTYDAKSTIIR